MNNIALLVSGDLLFAILAVYTAMIIGIPNWSVNPRIVDIFLFASMTLFSSYFIELYNSKKIYSFSPKERLATICLGLIVSFVALSTIFFMAPSEAFGRRLLVLSLLIFGIFQIVWHIAYDRFMNRVSMAQRVLILGTGDLARIMERIILLKQSNYVFSGYYDVRMDSEWPIVDRRSNMGKFAGGESNIETVQTLCSGLTEYVKKEKINKVVMALTERRGVFPLQELLNCKFAGIEVADAPSFYEEIMGKLLIENITPGWFIFSGGFKLDATRKLIKRGVDAFFSILGLILSLPLFPVIALLIKIDSKGPVFYKQTRIGESERHFELIKFRTMKHDAEANGAVWAQKNDCRVTHIGKLLRKTRLDEIPQFINVLKGDMSLIGPRPERPEFVKQLEEKIPYYAYRHFIKPGITGWAQIKYPYGASEEDALEKLRFDLYYIKHLSLLLDISIIIETIKVVLFGRGAR
ncbi:MAG TPA: TIGR03013 family XrtA/PEP-CTERM system glycosyltransferase [Syntrophales bacterium]|nr:TIGR03013 family XrtA/PEP-CTERM system glycosyltransferase [Syntrophales bacterium]